MYLKEISKLKEKNTKFKEENISLKKSLIVEKKKNSELTKQVAKFQAREKEYETLNNNYKEFRSLYLKLEKNFEQSELIRIEQAKIIKSLKKELNTFKPEDDRITSGNYTEISKSTKFSNLNDLIYPNNYKIPADTVTHSLEGKKLKSKKILKKAKK